jgi:hypothetical protein
MEGGAAQPDGRNRYMVRRWGDMVAIMASEEAGDKGGSGRPAKVTTPDYTRAQV